MNEIFEIIGNAGIVPVIKIEKAENAVPLAKALLKGCLPIMEITFRTESAEKAIKNIASDVPDILLGAGTIISLAQAESAIAAGAKFVVTPGINVKIVEFCIDNHIPIIPGCSNPTDIEIALGYGIRFLKFFPAEAFGGLSTIKALCAPYKDIMFIPTGGVDENNMLDYLAYPRILAVGGSFMVKTEWIEEERFDEITRNTRHAIFKMHGFKLSHIGINAKNEEDAQRIADTFSMLFGFDLKNGNNSIFASTDIEVNKGIGYGEKGHIAISTNSISRAIAFFKSQGIEIDLSTAKKKGDVMMAVYLKDEIAGFAVHLLQK